MPNILTKFTAYYIIFLSGSYGSKYNEKDVILMKQNVRKIICATLSALTLSTCTVSAAMLGTCYAADNAAIELVVENNAEKAILRNSSYWFYKTTVMTDVYSTPNGKKTGTINAGLTVRVFEKRNGWARISEPNAKTAWVKLANIKKSYVPGKVVALKGVIVRSAPSTVAPKVGKIGVNARVNVYRVYAANNLIWVALDEKETKWACAVVNGRKDIVLTPMILK